MEYRDRIQNQVTEYEQGKFYKENDLVYFERQFYVCTNNHTSDTERPHKLYFSRIGEEIMTWKVGVFYTPDDFVYHDEDIFVCVESHESSGNFEQDYWHNYWQRVTLNLIQWKKGGYCYQVGDVVRYNADIYVCETAHMTGDIFEYDKFEVVSKDIYQYEENKNEGIPY